MLRHTEKIQEITGFNCSPVTVTDREELLRWIGSQVKEKLLFLPDAEGPVIWPSYGINVLLFSLTVEEFPGIAA